jgi:flagellar hook-length control protein FliK
MQAAPGAAAIEGRAVSWPRTEPAAVATETLRSQEFPTAPAAPAAPADTASSAPATFLVGDWETAPAADEMTPTEILALVKTATATAAATTETEAGPVEAVSQGGDPIAPGISSLTSPDAVGRSSPVLREAGPSAQPGFLDLRHPLAPVRLSESIVWHLDQGVHEVSIDLHPAELGKLEIRLKLEGERVDLRIDTADTAVRDVVQTSLPNLASMLAARGLQLDQAQVFAQARVFTAGPGSGPATANGAVPAENRSRTVSGPRVIRRGLIDDYV